MSGVLNVCTANRCRSAFAERVLRAALPATVPVTSAGLRARPGEPIWPGAAAELERRGISSLGFDAHPVTAALVAGADLVLTATRAHRDELLAAHPRALGRAFTWRELAWLVSGMGPDQLPAGGAVSRVRALPAAARSRRGLLVPPPPEEFDVVDPVGLPDPAMATAADQIDVALATVLRVLTGPAFR
jgi:protein-tyrosine phosphatase